MKKTIAVLLSMLMVLPFAFASVKVGERVSVYDEGDAVVGESGYVDISSYNVPDVFVCATKDGKVGEYGMNLNSAVQLGRAIELIRQLVTKSFAGFDQYGCLRTRV